MNLFDDYYSLDYYTTLQELTADPSVTFGTPQDKQTLELYHDSILTKLWGVELSLKKLKSIEPLQIFKPGRPPDDLLRGRLTLTHFLDTFFVNAISGLEIAAQEVNVYYGLGIQEEDVSIRAVRRMLQGGRAGAPIENFFMLLTTAPDGEWFTKLNNYRRCTLHRRATVKEIRGEFRLKDYTATTTTLVPSSLRIALPNDPLSLDPVFDPANEIEMIDYCEGAFLQTLLNLDDLFKIIESSLATTHRIPIP